MNNQMPPRQITTLVRYGQGYALVIDGLLLDLLKISPEAPLEVTTDGRSIVVTPVADDANRQRVAKSMETLDKRYGRTMRRLAE